MAKFDTFEEVYAPDPETWRAWLETHHGEAPGVWLVYYKKAAPQPSVVWEQAVREALCFGWIDSKIESIDDERYRQVFTPRKPKSVWSRVNKDHVAELEAAGVIAPAGQSAIDRAKEDGSWSALDEVEALVVPDDLGAALDAQGLREAFTAQGRTAQKNALYRLWSAKREATRQRRIDEILASLSHRT